MRVLVTGGAGFIGSHIVDALLADGHEVRVLDSLSPSVHPERPDYLHPHAQLLEGDVTDPDTVNIAVRGVDAVCHQAAKVGLGLDIDDIYDYARDNDLGTAVLLRALARTHFKGRFVLASSMVVYGEGRYRCNTHGLVEPASRRVEDLKAGRFEPQCPDCGEPLAPESVPEDARLDPRNVYAATKLHQEHLCAAFSRETGVPITALRYHNVYGPRMPRDTPYAGVASIFRSAIAAGRPPQVYEDGRQLRDFVHVRDVARANLIAITGPTPQTGPFNICSGTPRTVGEMATALCHASAQDPPLTPQITGRFRLGDVRHVFASAERAQTVLGFHAQEDFNAGMAEFGHAPLRASVSEPVMGNGAAPA